MVQAELMGQTMGRPKGKRTERDDITTKADRAVISKARLVAAHRGINLAELVSETLRPHIDKQYAQMLRELEAEPK